MEEKRQPYVDQYGILHVPLIGGQTSPLWESKDFEYDPGANEAWRSVHKPRRDGQVFSPQGWLEAAIRQWEMFGGNYTGWDGKRYRIDPHVTDPYDLADFYWKRQNQKWSAWDAYGKGWKSYQWVNNLIKTFGIEDRQIKGLLRHQADDQWRAWELSSYQAPQPAYAT